MLPWVRHKRSEERSSNPDYLDCDTCMNDVPHSTRRLWNCGYLPRHQWGHGPPRVKGHEPSEGCDACPGYYISLPDVCHAELAHAWWDKGQLRDYCDGETPTAMLRDCVTILHSSHNDVEMTTIREAEGKHRGP